MSTLDQEWVQGDKKLLIHIESLNRPTQQPDLYALHGHKANNRDRSIRGKAIGTTLIDQKIKQHYITLFHYCVMLFNRLILLKLILICANKFSVGNISSKSIEVIFYAVKDSLISSNSTTFSCSIIFP